VDNNVTIGEKAKIWHFSHVLADSKIGENCNIGRYAFIGAVAVVTKDIPNHALMVGNPAKQIGLLCECGEKLDANLKCPACSGVYQRAIDGIITKHAEQY